MAKKISSFFGELKRRKVFKVAGVYVAVGLGVLGAAEVILDPLGLSAVRPYIVILTLLGFPIALVLGWAFEVRPDSGSVNLSEEQEPVEPPDAADGGGPGDPELQVPNPLAIAVLPFSNLSDDAQNEYFSDGITEDILTHLSRIKDLHVISRTSVMMYKGTSKPVREIAAELKVGTILEGSVRRAGDRVRISAQLIEASTDKHLWADTLDRDLTDVFRIQTEVAKEIAGALKARLTASEMELLSKVPTTNMDAYGLWLRGRAAFGEVNPASVKRGLELFRRAIELDPQYPHPYVGIADCYIYLSIMGVLAVEECRGEAKAAAERALALDGSLAEAHATLACVDCWLAWDWTRAEEGFIRALELNPNSSWARAYFASLLTASGRMPEALGEMDLALRLDPLSLEIARMDGLYSYHARDFSRAEQRFQRVLASDPDSLGALTGLALLRIAEGQTAEAVELSRQVAKEQSAVQLTHPLLAYAYASHQMHEEARESLAIIAEDRVATERGNYLVASALAELGELERGIEALYGALKIREPYLMYLAVAPNYDLLRGHPRFHGLLKEIGLKRQA